MACRGRCGRDFSDILGARNVSEAQEFPRINPKDPNQHVLFKVEDQYRGLPEPYRAQPRDMWDSDHVKMPYDSNSTYVVSGEDGEGQTLRRWEVIRSILSQPINNTDDLTDAILRYNGKYRGKWTFPTLKKFIHRMSEGERHSFFNKTIKGMAALALQIEDLFQAPVPLLKQRQNESVSMSQQQISSILANAFFCTFPNRNSRKKDDEYASYPNINFSSLFESTTKGYEDVLAKLQCIIHYFNRVLVNVPTGVVTFARRFVPRQNCPDWQTSTTLVKDLHLHIDCHTAIEDAHGLIQVDFANKYIGGGVIGHGSVQEEIRFVICPELLASKLFTEVLNDTEAIMIIGSERYSSYSGYSRTFRFDGDYVDNTPYDSSNRRKCAVLAIDAKPYSSSRHEDKRDNITRELNKAWVGFSFYASERGRSFPGVATGNWGSGAFGGSKSLKSLIQLIACAQARRPMAYYSFHDCALLEDLDSVYNSIKSYNITVGQIYNYIVEKFVKVDPKTRNLKSFDFATSSRRPNRGRNNPRPYSRGSDGGDQKEAEEGSNAQEEEVEEISNSSAERDPMQTASRKTRSVHCGAGPGQEEISGAILKKIINDSPDLFSLDEYQDSPDLLPDKPETTQSNHDQSTGPKNENKMADGDKMAGSKRTSNHTSRLLDEMQKFDDANGTLNLSIPSDEKKSVLNDPDSPMDVDKTSESPEVKKKISGKKITDYFSKI